MGEELKILGTEPRQDLENLDEDEKINEHTSKTSKEAKKELENWKSPEIQKKLFQKLEEKGVLKKNAEGKYGLINIMKIFNEDFFNSIKPRIIFSINKKYISYSKYRIIQSLIDSGITTKEEMLNQDKDEILSGYLWDQFNNKAGREGREKIDMYNYKELLDISLKELKDLEFITETEDKKTIIDIQKIKNEFNNLNYILKNTKYIKKLYYRKEIANNLLKLYSELFKNIKGISKDDYEKNIQEEKELLYMPKNSKEALDIEKIKNSKFYLSLKDFIKKGSLYSDAYGNIDDLNLREISLALLLYHPYYEDAYRDKETGKLMLKNDQGEYIPFSAQYITEKYGAFGNQKEKGNSLTSGRLFLRKHLPNLIKKDLLRPTDFRIRSKSSTNESERIVKKIGRDGQTIFNNVKHTLGTQYENYIAYQINKQQGAIVDPKNNKILAYFNIFDQDELEKTKKGYYTAGIKKTNPQTVNFDQDQSSLDKEDIKKQEAVKDFSKIFDAENYLQEQYNINISNFSKKEQEAIVKMMSQINILEKNKFDKFVQQYGEQGLKTFLSLETEKDMSNKILSIGENIDAHSANIIFARYTEIINSIEQIKKGLLKFFADEQIDENDLKKISSQILKRANDLLISFSNKIKSGEEIDEEEILKELENFNSDALVFSSIFKTAYKKGSLSFEEIRGLDYQTFSSGELNEKKKEMIRNLIALNYPHEKQKKDILKKVAESFQNKNKSVWHLLSRTLGKKEEIISCLRFDDIDEKNVYGATFNVGVSYRGSKIGEAMFERVMGEVAQEKRVHAIAEVGKEVSSFYVGRGGFNVVGIEQNEKTGIYYYNIERFDPENEYYASKRTLDQKLMSYYDPEKTVEELVILQKYILVKREDINQQKNIKDINYLLDSNYLMTKIIKHSDKESAEQKNYLVFEKKVDLELEKSA